MPEIGDADETIKIRIQTEGKKTVEEVLTLLKELQQQANVVTSENRKKASVEKQIDKELIERKKQYIQEHTTNIKQQAALITEISKQEAQAQTQASQQVKAAYDNEMKSRKEWADFLKQDQTQKRDQTKEWIANNQQQANVAKDTATQTAKAQVAASQQAKEAYNNEMKSRKEWAEFLKQDQTQKRQQTQEQLKETQQQANIIKETQEKTKGAVDKTKDSYQSLKQVLSSFGGIGSMLATALTGSLGVILAIIAAMKLLGDQLKQVAKAGYEFAKATYQLQIGLNAIRRTGTEITLEDVYDNLDKLQEKFGIFSRKELVEGSAALINLTRDFKLTKDEIFNLQDAVATLAVVNGRTMDDVQRTVALAISSGYTEGLQRLGVSINRVTIALEAERLGWGRNYMSLTESQRAQATYNLILQKTKKYQDDLESYQLKAPGMIDSLTASWKDLKTELGDLIQTYGVFAGVLNTVLEGIINFVREVKKSKINELFIEQAGNIAGLIAVFDAYRDRLKGKPVTGSTDDIFNAAKKGFIEDLEEPTVETGWLKNRLEEEEKMAEELPPIAQELGEDLEEIEEDYEDTLKDNWEDYLDDKQDLTMDYIQKGLDIEEEFGERLKEIQDSYTDDTKKAWEDYYQSIADENLDYNQNVADANEELHKDLIEAEEDYQDKMHELRQKFLFDLEDAVRERDAKQAMLLIRQYNFDKTQIKEDKDEDIEDIKQNHKEELAELKKQHQRKLAEIKTQLNRQLAEIQSEYETELAELNIWKAEEYKAREEWYAKELALAEASWIIQNAKAKKARSDALIDLVKDYNKQYNLTARQWARLLELAAEYISADGGLTRLQQAYWNWVAANAAAVNSSSVIDPPDWGGAYAKGGEITVNKPTLAMFGERGTETATFTPGSKSGGSRGEIGIKVYLEDGLRAEIIDDALGEFADVMVSVEKVR